jgi:hypothetical protein
MPKMLDSDPVPAIGLNETERKVLLELLDQSLKQTMVEAHRTDNPSYREHIEERQRIIQGLIGKVHEIQGDVDLK